MVCAVSRNHDYRRGRTRYSGQCYCADDCVGLRACAAGDLRSGASTGDKSVRLCCGRKPARESGLYEFANLSYAEEEITCDREQQSESRGNGDVEPDGPMSVSKCGPDGQAKSNCHERKQTQHWADGDIHFGGKKL